MTQCNTCGSTTENIKYCSLKCFGISLRGKKPRNWIDRTPVLCEHCKKEYIPSGTDQGRFCSLRCYALFMSKAKNGVPFSRGGGGGKREDLGGLYVRSRWEANYCRYLNWLLARKEILKWEYEPDTFEFVGIKKGTRFYTPDFKIWEKDGTVPYHEIKGWMDDESKTKLKRMAKYHPKVKIVIIGGPEYGAIAKVMKSILPFWE